MKRYWWIGILGLIIWVVVLFVSEWPDENTRVVICDVGQGDGMIIMRSFSQMVIDVGQNDGSMMRCLGEELPFWDRNLEAVIITHEDSDHSGGLEEISSSYKVSKLVTVNNAVEEIRQKLDKDKEILIAYSGQEWYFAGVRGEVL